MKIITKEIPDTQKIIVIGGPTASGKSKFAVNIALQQPSVIINADSMQIYNEIPIVTAQPPLAEQASIPHLLYGALPAQKACSAGIWLDFACKQIDLAHANGQTPILVGGTGMYLKCLMQGVSYVPEIPDDIRTETRALAAEIGAEAMHEKLTAQDSEMANRLKSTDTQRISRAIEVLQHTGKSLSHWQAQPNKTFYDASAFEFHFVNPPRNELYANCDARFEWMVDNGAIEEVEALLELNISPELPAMKALGIPEIISYLHGESTKDDMKESAQKSTRNYAKRQVTWFRNQF
jgi:tRNA dimethylallyltransferase